MVNAAGDAAPGIVSAIEWITKAIGQSSPYPGCTNTITVTLSTTVPLVHDCPTEVYLEMTNFRYETTYAEDANHVVSFVDRLGDLDYNIDWVAGVSPETGSVFLSPLQSICATVNETNDNMYFADAYFYDDGSPGNGYWSSGYVLSGSPAANEYGAENGVGYTSGGPGFTVDKKMRLWPYMTTTPDSEYVFSFDIVNPVEQQSSPSISIELFGTPIAKVAMDRDPGMPCCTSCTTTGSAVAGDSSPLEVHTPFFCTKIIGQSTPNPCQLNELTVTMTANVPLLGGKSVITISQLYGAHFEDGEIDILDDSGAEHHLLFGSNFTSSAGTGSWNNNTKELTLYLVGDAECASEYVFSFKLYNNPEAQNEQDVMISASYVGNSRELYEAGVSIAATSMSYPVGNDVETYPLKVIQAEFDYLHATQSTE
eukprot:3582053-Rhodomonas_salina.1